MYSTAQLEYELCEHWSKLKRLSKYSEIELRKVSTLITSTIKFINAELIPQPFFVEAVELTQDIDIDDAEFVALTKHIRGKLWTGDKELLKGLKRKKWNNLTTTDELFSAIVKRR